MTLTKTDYLKALPKDLAAGLVVFLVALPLCLGIALASNAPLMAGIVSGVVGGLVVAWISGSHSSVSGPAAGLAAVVFAQVVTLKSYEAFVVVVILAGLIQIALGCARAGFIAAFFPSSVIKGLLAAIGILLILKQVPHVVGHDADPEGEMDFTQPDGKNTFSELFATVFDVQLGALIVGVLCLGLLLIWDRTSLKKSIVPGPLVVVGLGIALNFILQKLGGRLVIEPSHLVQVPATGDFTSLFSSLPKPDFSALLKPQVYTAAITVAVVASLETLLNLEAVDKLDPRKRVSPPNRELVAQGIGNVVAGFLGGLPITSVIVRSSVNINAGAVTRISAVVHGLLLLVLVIVASSLLNQIPLAALAAILLATGFKLASPQLFRKMWAEGRNQFLPFIATILAIVFTDLLIGILVGLIVSIGFILHSNFRRPLRRFMEHHVSGEVLRIELASQVSFLNRAVLEKSLNSVPAGGHLVLDARNSDYIDPDILDLIQDFRNEVAPARNITLSLLGFKDRYIMEDTIQYVDVSTREVRNQLEPAQVLKLLKDGNERFVSGQRLSRDLIRQVDATSKAQYPLAVVLGCMDSRTSTELIFDLGLGDIFSIRVAGNIATDDALASMEFGCAIAGAKLLLVLGHTRCGAVGAAVDMACRKVDPRTTTGCEHIQVITNYLQSAINIEDLARGGAADVTGQREASVDQVARANVLHTISVIRNRSSTLRKLIDSGSIAIVGALYDVRNGRVEFFTD